MNSQSNQNRQSSGTKKSESTSSTESAYSPQQRSENGQSENNSHSKSLNSQSSFNAILFNKKDEIMEVLSTSQIIFMFIGFLALAFAPSMFSKIEYIKEWTMKRYPEPQGGWSDLQDFWITIVGAGVIWITMQMSRKLTYNYFYTHCKEKNDEIIRIAKTHKSCDSFYKSIYYSIAVLWGYSLVKDLYFIPPALLGNGKIDKIESQFPYNGFPQSFKIYYLGTMGFHFYSTIHHLVHKARNDFVEMFLHHLATLFLYGISYYLYRWEFGSLIMFLHDIADIPTSCIKCWSETTFNKVTLFFFIAMSTSWLYTRIYLFPYIIYEAYRVDPYEGNFPIVSSFCTILLSCLFILHVYWFYLLMTGVKRYLKKGKIDDMQQKIRSSSEKKKKEN